MVTWLIGGLATVVATGLLYWIRPGKRPSPLADRSIMTETADGEPLNFWFEQPAERDEQLGQRIRPSLHTGHLLNTASTLRSGI